MGNIIFNHFLKSCNINSMQPAPEEDVEQAAL